MGCGSASIKRDKDIRIEKKITRSQTITTRAAYASFKQAQVTKFLAQLFPEEVPAELANLPYKLSFDSHGISYSLGYSEIDFLNSAVDSTVSLVGSNSSLISAAIDLLKTEVQFQ